MALVTVPHDSAEENFVDVVVRREIEVVHRTVPDGLGHELPAVVEIGLAFCVVALQLVLSVARGFSLVAGGAPVSNPMKSESSVQLEIGCQDPSPFQDGEMVVAAACFLQAQRVRRSLMRPAWAVLSNSRVRAFPTQLETTTLGIEQPGADVLGSGKELVSVVCVPGRCARATHSGSGLG